MTTEASPPCWAGPASADATQESHSSPRSVLGHRFLVQSPGLSPTIPLWRHSAEARCSPRAVLGARLETRPVLTLHIRPGALECSGSTRPAGLPAPALPPSRPCLNTRREGHGGPAPSGSCRWSLFCRSDRHPEQSANTMLLFF